ncbi:MAG TPA: ATP-binding protein [Gaiellaceae bacterium]
MSLRLLASYLALTVVVLIGLEVPLAIVDAQNQRKDLTAKIARDAFAAASLSEDVLQSTGRSAQLQRVADHYRVATGGRLVIVNRRGLAVADSQPTTPGERNFATRREIIAALRGRTASGIRTSETLHERLLYVAVPVASGGVVHGAVRITYPTATLDARIRRYRLALLAVAAVVLGAATAIGLVLSQSIVRPLKRLRETAERVAEGDLAARAPENVGPPEIRTLAARMNESTRRLSVLIGTQDQFVSDASHELRTPLTALRLRLETGDTAGALAEVDRLAQLVDELLALARADAAVDPAEPLDIGQVVRVRIDAWRPLAEERGVRLDSTTDDVSVRAGAGRVQEVLDNLLANALDAAPADSQVKVLAAKGELHVVDGGPGLTEEQRERAFDRFWRASDKPGSGLGLAIAKRLVERDGGNIELRRATTGGIDAVVRYRTA